MSAPAGGIEHAEREEPARRRLRIRARQLGHRLQVALEGRAHAPAHQVADERLRRVVDAAALAAALVRQPEELARPHLGGAGVGGDVAVGPRVVAQIPVGDGQAKRQEALVDVPQVPDLEARVVEPGPRLGIDPQRDESRPHGRVGERGALQHPGALEAVRGEEVTVVGGDGEGIVPGAHGAHEDEQAVAEGRRARVEPVCLLVGVPHEPGEGAPPVRLVRHRQIAGALRVEEEEDAEDECEAGGLELPARRIAREIPALPGGPAAQLETEGREHPLTHGVVEALSEPGAEVPRLGQRRLEPTLGQVGRAQEPEQRTILRGDRRGVELEIAADRRAARRARLEETHARARSEKAVASAVAQAVVEENSLGRTPFRVEPRESGRVGKRPDDGHGPLTVAGEISARRETLQDVAELLEQIAPVAGSVRRQGGERRPAGGCPQALAVEVIGAEPADDQTGDGPPVEPVELLGKRPDGLERRQLGQPSQHIQQPAGLDDTERSVCSQRPERQNGAFRVWLVGDHQQRVGPSTRPCPPCPPKRPLVGRRDARQLDAGHERALHERVRIHGQAARARDPHERREELAGIHRGEPPAQRMARG